MLANGPRQDQGFYRMTSPTQYPQSTVSNSQYFTPNIASLQLTSPKAAYLAPLSHLHIDSSHPASDSHYMNTTPLSYPPINVHQSTPSLGDFGHLETSPPPMLGENDPPRTPWDHLGVSSNHLSPNNAQQSSISLSRRSYHKRLSSGSSIGSVGPESPYTSSSVYPHIVDSDSTSFSSPPIDPFDGDYSAYTQPSKPFFAPSNSLVHHNSFLAPAFQDYNPAAPHDAESLMAVQTAMRQALMEERGSDTGPHGLPASRLSYGEEYDRGSRASGELRSTVPNLDRTMSDVYQDELYNPTVPTSTSSPQLRTSTNQTNLLSPYRTVFTDRLQAANDGHLSARSSPPVATISREHSPFRPTSNLYAVDPVPRLTSAAHMREQQKAESDARAQRDHQPGLHDPVSPRTISPKEAQLDYIGTEEEVKMPLFPQENLQKRGHRFPTNNSKNDRHQSQGNVNRNNTERDQDDGGHNKRQSPPIYPPTSAPATSSSNFTFLPPSVPGNSQLPQQYPFISNIRRQSSSVRSNSDQIPEFPAHLTSMESSKSESGQDQSSSRQYMSDAESSMRSPSSPGLRRPSNTTADAGSYTCTTVGCSARFDTAFKLQKHKREAHRQSTPQKAAPTTPTLSSTSSASNLSANVISRNNQAGPHKCERINPSTGKPCNTIFSRSYDLTRHEDTIHNNRKQKVRCHLCTEEKTFSRNDALTRHMRVVHPDVDFMGKTKRRAP